MLRYVLPLLASFACLIGGQGISPAGAQPWPSRPIRIVVTFPPGGSSDIVARVLADALGPKLNARVVVDNRPGAGGTLAAQHVATQPADGYTLMLSNSAAITTASPLYPRAGYDPLTSFTHVSHIGTVPMVILANPRLVPATDLSGLIAWAHAQPRPPSFGTSGNGSVGHILGELFQRQAGLRLNHVPYRGSVAMLLNLLSGELPIAFDTLPQHLEHIAAGRLRALAVASRQRSPAVPQVRTTREEGFPYLQLENWLGVSGPAGLPASVVERLNAGVMAALRAPEVIDRLEEHAIVPQPMGPAEFTAFVTRDVNETGGMIQRLRIQLE